MVHDVNKNKIPCVLCLIFLYIVYVMCDVVLIFQSTIKLSPRQSCNSDGLLHDMYSAS